MIFAYFAPEPILPIASTLTAVVGFVLISARGAVVWLTRGVRARAER